MQEENGAMAVLRMMTQTASWLHMDEQLLRESLDERKRILCEEEPAQENRY